MPYRRGYYRRNRNGTRTYVRGGFRRSPWNTTDSIAGCWCLLIIISLAFVVETYGLILIPIGIFYYIYNRSKNSNQEINQYQSNPVQTPINNSYGQSFNLSYNYSTNITKYCTQCGSQIPRDANFCEFCGNKCNNN